MALQEHTHTTSLLDRHHLARKTLIHILIIAKSKTCWVYDLEIGSVSSKNTENLQRVEEGRDRAKDFQGALLHSLINGIGTLGSEGMLRFD